MTLFESDKIPYRKSAVIAGITLLTFRRMLHDADIIIMIQLL